MKIVYIVPNVNNEGGVARVIAIKANYLIEKLGYEVAIVTQNKGNSPLFYHFNPKITFFDMMLKGNPFQFFATYQKVLNQKIKLINPDVIIVCDNGLKAYTIPFILKTKIPIILEMHSSKLIEEYQTKNNFLSKLKLYFSTIFKVFAIKHFDEFIVETPESIKEWNVKKGIVIPNPLWFSTVSFSELNSKKAIAVGRHNYEKGFDRLLNIWQKIVKKYPDWCLEIYGKSSKNTELQLLAQNLKITNNVNFFEPVKEINEKYLEASMYLLTSRFEGFGMVLIEAMASGLPCIAYDCPCGPKAIIDNKKNGFLIENGNESDFVNAIETLIEDQNLRIEMGKNAKISSQLYNIDTIMQTWNELFLELKKK
jgi:glycosyltransferase involved in cell wall biosynthesis